MVNFIPLKYEQHKKDLIKLNEEYLSWIASEMQKRYNIDMVVLMGISVREYVEKTVENFASYLPPEGIYYLIQSSNSLFGMGAIRELKNGIGEIKRMYIQQKYRGKGYGKTLLDLLLNRGKEFGFSSIRLDTGIFMVAAQKVYRNAGFQERERYIESEVPSFFLPHWIFMEKHI
jgi:ribosomal protein S18 acetylase RimI-like enzyme